MSLHKADTPQRTPDDLLKLARLKYLTETALPARARAEGWPIHFDHCFKRICFDHAFADVWYRHLEKPAERSLGGDALDRALACAEALFEAGRPLLQRRNQESLAYRGKGGGGSTTSPVSRRTTRPRQR